MNKKLFFSYLRKNLPENKYKNRFLEDLTEHLDDMEYEESFKGKIKETKLLNRLGEPSNILFTYKKLMNKQSKISIYLESFIWGILTCPLFIWPFMANSFTEATEHILYKTLIWISSLAFTFFAFKVLYYYIFSHLKVLNLTLNKNEKIASFSLTLVLPILSSLLYIPTFYFSADERQDYIFPFIIMSYLLVIAISAWKEFKTILNTNISLKNIWLYDLIFIASLIIISLQINILSMLGFVVFFVFLANTSLDINYIITGIIATFISTYYLIDIVHNLKNRTMSKLPVFKIFVVIILIYGLCFPNKVNNQLNFSKKYINVTEKIERDEMGIYYNWSKSLNKLDEFPNFPYEISKDKENFEIKQFSTDKKFTLTSPYNLKNLQIKNGNFDPISHIYNKEEFLSSDFKCVNKKDSAETIDDLDANSKLTLGGETCCYELYYKNELIYKSNAELLQNILISVDEKFLLIHIEDPFKEIEDIYLVEI